MVRCLYCERSHVSCVMPACSDPGIVFSGLLRQARVELRVEDARRHVAFACATAMDKELEASKDRRKDIVVIMNFARKQRKHIYPLPVVDPPPRPFCLFPYLLTHSIPLFGLRTIKKSKSRASENSGDKMAGLDWAGPDQRRGTSRTAARIGRRGVLGGDQRPDDPKTRRIEFLRLPGHFQFWRTHLRAESGRHANHGFSPVAAVGHRCASMYGNRRPCSSMTMRSQHSQPNLRDAYPHLPESHSSADVLPSAHALPSSTPHIARHRF